jgi:hypothetical protein
MIQELEHYYCQCVPIWWEPARVGKNAVRPGTAEAEFCRGRYLPFGVIYLIAVLAIP